MDGILPVYKPAGITSYDCIRRLKRELPKGTKIGHAGTLDPFAEGVLLILLGSATRRFDEIRGWHKTYLAGARLGYYSDTLDVTGTIAIKPSGRSTNLSIDLIQKVAERFEGQIEQTIPAYSAAKVAGRPRYLYARQGEEVPAKSKVVRVDSVRVQSYQSSKRGGKVEMRIVCGSGTYIRQLSYDIFRSLGIESYLETLVREEVGNIKIDDCLRLEQLEQQGGGEVLAKNVM